MDPCSKVVHSPVHSPQDPSEGFLPNLLTCSWIKLGLAWDDGDDDDDDRHHDDDDNFLTLILHRQMCLFMSL